MAFSQFKCRQTMTIVLKPLPVEEAFANLYSCLHATLGIDFSDDLVRFLVLCTLESRRFFFFPCLS